MRYVLRPLFPFGNGDRLLFIGGERSNKHRILNDPRITFRGQRLPTRTTAIKVLLCSIAILATNMLIPPNPTAIQPGYIIMGSANVRVTYVSRDLPGLGRSPGSPGILRFWQRCFTV